jgi:putative hydrolase of the HAD superfamily
VNGAKHGYVGEMPEQPQIRAIILDYTGVMTAPIPFSFGSASPDSPPGAADGNSAMSALRKLMADELRNPDPEGAWNKLERGETSLATFANHVAAHHPMAGEFFKTTAGQLMSTLPIRPEMVERLQTWRAAGYRTALLTNNVAEWRPLWQGKLRESSALHLFDVVIDSSEVGMRKPEERIYLHATSVLGLEPHEVVFVDDFAHNVEGARTVGLHAIFATADDDHYRELDALLTGINFEAAEE